MLFTSYGFLGFIAVLIPLYYLVPKRGQWPLLLAASCLFYCLAGPGYLLYLLTTAATVWFAALRIEENARRQSAYLKEHREDLSRDDKKAYKAGQKRIRTRWTAACLTLNIGILAAVKYTNFFIANANSVLGALGRTELSFVRLALPMGISFYTFQAAGYLVDVYRGKYPAEKNPFRFLLFVSFFPQLVQGPISRFDDLSRTLYQEHPFDSRTVCSGLQRILWGYFKKMVVADRILTAVSAITGHPDTYSGAYVLAGMLFYTLELYADFTGGIDVTIGISEAMGITVQENFRRPYFSKSLKEYWRRWHISLCSWFREYLFYPVSTSKAMQKFSKFARRRFGDTVGRRLPVYISSFVVWFATGIWHGASWNFVVWGLCNWAVLMISEELEPLYRKFHEKFHVNGKSAYKLFQAARTFLLVCVLNIFDCYPALSTTAGAVGSMFAARNWGVLWDGSLLALGLSGLDYAILAAGTLLMLAVSLVQRSGSVREKIRAMRYPARFVIWYGLFLAVLLMGAYGIGYDASQFIYNQF